MAFGTDPLGGDPFDRIDSVLDRPFRGLGRASAPAYRKEFDPVEYEQKRNWLLGGAMSGLRGIGWALSAPGDYLRGAVSGNLGQRKSGRDILDQFGVTSKSDKGWGAWGAGLAADVATDPLMLLGLGPATATTKAGAALGKLGPLEGGIQAMSRADRLAGFRALESGLAGTAQQIRHAHLHAPGKIASGVQEAQVVKELGRPLRAGEPLASLAKVQLPFGIGPRLNIGTRPWAQKVAGGMDRLGESLRFGNPVGRGLGSLFDPSVWEATGRVGQHAYARPGGGADVMRAAMAGGRERLAPLHLGVEKLLRARPNDPAYEGELLRAINAVAEGAPVGHYDPAILAEADPLGRELKALYAGNLDIERAAGASTKEYSSPWGLGYTHRQALHGVPGASAGRSRAMPAHMGYDAARNPNLAVPGGTDRVNLWMEQGLADPSLPLPGVRMQIYKDSLDDLREIRRLGTYQGQVNPAAKLGLWDHAEKVALELRKMRGMTGGNPFGPLFSLDPIGLASAYLDRSATKQGGLEAIFRSIGETAVPAGTHPRGAATPLTSVLKQLGLKHWADTPGVPIRGAGVKALEALAPKGAPMAYDLANMVKTKGPNVGMPSTKGLNRALRGYELPAEAVAEIMKQNAAGALPEQLKGLAGVGSSFTNLFRALAYPIWAGSHVRNASTAGVNMLRTDTPMGALKSLVEQWREMRNPNFADPALAAERASQHAHGGVGSGWGAATDTAGLNVPQRMAIGARVTPSLPMSHVLGPAGTSPTGTAAGDALNLIFNEGLWGTLKNVGSAAKQVAQHPRDWRTALSENLGVKGVGGQLADTLPAVKGGWRMGENIENLFRGAQMKGLVRQGYSPAEAGRQMLKYQFDYGAHGFTPFERNVMRQIVPFYGFLRKNVPLQIETLATRPGIIGAQVAPMMQNRNTEGDFIPQYLQGSISAPLGRPVGGNQRFLSTFGLPAEEAFGRMQFYPGDLGRSLGETAGGFAANLNPLLKGPLESLTNRQFFSGRQLSDLKAPSLAQSIGGVFGGDNPDRDRMIAQVLMNSPLTRFVTTAERLGDPRKEWWAKALNLGTGVRVTDVDVDRQKAIEMRDAMLRLQSSLPHMASYTSFYPKPEFKDQLTPQDTELLRTYATYQKRAQEYAEKRRLQEATGIR